jgi:phage recombination protein Bet
MSTQPQVAMEILKHQDVITVTHEQMKLARQTVASKLDDNQFSLYLYNCSRLGVHPLDGLLIPVIRTDNEEKRLTFVNTVDLLRSRADATGDYAGSDDPVFEYHMKDANCPSDAKVTVWKFVQGEKCAFTASARWEEHYPGEKVGFMWRSKPHVMLGKCAEALALRKAFPKQLSGLYIPEELQQEVDSRTTARQPQKVGKRPAPAQTGNVFCADCGSTNGHETSCKYYKQPEAEKQEAEKWLVNVESVDQRSNEKNKDFRVLTCTNAANKQVILYGWDKKLFERLDAIKSDTRCMFMVKVRQGWDGKTYYAIESIVEITGEKKPSATPDLQEDAQEPFL